MPLKRENLRKSTEEARASLDRIRELLERAPSLKDDPEVQKLLEEIETEYRSLEIKDLKEKVIRELEEKIKKRKQE